MNGLKILFFLLCIFSFNSYAQDSELYCGIQQTKVSGEKFESVSVLSPASKSASQSKKIEEHFIHPQEVYVLNYSQPATKNLNTTMTLNIPLGSRNLQLELQEFKMEYQLTTSSGQNVAQNKNIRHYHGVVKDDSNSIVAITFGENEIIGLVATDEGNFNLALDRQSGEHIFYNDKNVKKKPEFICTTQADDFFDVYSADVLLQSTRATVTQKYVRLYFETEFDVYQTRGNSVSSVETFMTGIYNQVAVLYRNESILTSLSQIHVWDTADPFTSTTTAGLLTQFQNTRTSFNGDLGQLVTFRDIGGGEAAGFNGLCNNSVSQRLSVAMLHNNFQNTPNYSWSVFVVTHELGHLFGSRHTHACVWNGNNTAIDGCAGGTEGGCSVPSIPSNGGTIMSYCHQQSVGINFNLGFGLQPGNVIRNSVANASCLISLTGSDLICSGSPQTFTVFNAPAGFTWNKSSNLNLSGSGASVSVSATSSSVSAVGWVSINQGGRELARLNVWVGPPVISITGSTSVPAVPPGQGGGFSYTAVYPNYTGPLITGYEWALSPVNQGAIYNYGYWANVYFYPEGYYQLTSRACNACGYGPWAFLYVDVGDRSLSSVYPNPVSDMLTVSFDPVQAANRKASLKSSGPTQTARTLALNIKLMDSFGVVHRQAISAGETIMLDVSSLRNGMYFLHVHDGIAAAPEVHKIIVNH